MSESIFQNSGCVNTILGSLNQLSSFLPLNYRIDKRTTLNKKYGVLKDLEPTSIPKLMYFGVGIGGCDCATAVNSVPQHVKKLPDGRNMDIYRPIPFRMVPISGGSKDLSFEERKKYRMRCVMDLKDPNDPDGEKITYACYYLKTIEWSEDTVDILRCNADGTEYNYDFEESYLDPSSPSIATTGGSLVSADRVIVRALGKCAIEGNELKEAMSILYGVDYCTVSEFGFYTGYDVYVRADENVEVDEDGNAVEAEALIENTEINDDDDVETDRTDYSRNNREAAYVQLAKHKTQMPITLDGTNSELVTQISFETSNSISI